MVGVMVEVAMAAEVMGVGGAGAERRVGSPTHPAVCTRMWRAPTLPEDRADAVRAYVKGEALCDAGLVQEGVRSFKAARTQAWELDGEDWPGWARELYEAFSAGCSVDCAATPTLVAEQGSSGLHPRLTDLRRGCLSPRAAHADWWRAPEAVTAVADALRKRHFVVLDGFAGAEAAARLRGACTDASSQLQPAADRSRAKARSDQVAWEPVGFEALSERADTLLGLLRRSRCTPEIEGVVSRQRLMFSRYAAGDYFARHVDNDCAGGHGPRCSPRVLTAVYYLQQSCWDAHTDGGCLRLFSPQCVTTADGDDDAEEAEEAVRGGAGQPRGADALLDIAPIADRLVLFYSDQRCPHEVLPVLRAGAERFAVTIWYMGARTWVPPTGTAHDSSLVPLWEEEEGMG